MADSTQALTQLIKILEPLSSEDRRRNIDAALTFLGEARSAVTPRTPSATNPPENETGSHHHLPSGVSGRMNQYDLTTEQVERVFEFQDDNTFAIFDVPGSSTRERALNMYILTGLGTFLATGERKFTDSLARAKCKEHSCLDAANHAKTLNAKHPEFHGDKKSGWTVTVPGLKRGTELVKQMADRASK